MHDGTGADDAKEHFGFPVDLSVNETKRLFANPECKLEPRTGELSRLLLKHNGKWLEVGRTDLMDDVRTTLSHMHPDTFTPDPVSHYRSIIAYGARITEDGIFIVDAKSDG